MARPNWSIQYYLTAVVLVTLLFTVSYNFGMQTWEGQSQPLYRSLEVVLQTFTTTGYGGDAPWSSLHMNVLVMVMQVTGIGLILTGVDVFAVPWLQNALAVDPPKAVSDVSNHVVVCGRTHPGGALVGELELRDRDYVLVEPDRETAIDRHRDGYPVVYGDPESRNSLERAAIGEARALLVDTAADTTASIVLAAKEAAPDVSAVTLVEDDDLAEYHRIAGADEVLSPRALVGRSLAAQVPTTVSTVVEDGIAIGEDIELVELVVREGSDLAGRSYADADVRERFGVTVVGAWVDADLELSIDPDTVIEAGTRLLVAGEPDELERIRDATTASMRSLGPQDVVIAGNGQTGTAARKALAEADTEVTVLDREDGPGVNVVGDAREPETLDAAGVGDARVLLLALGDDTSSVFATLVARDRNPDLDIVVRADERVDEPKLYRAGADYVQSLSTVSGRMVVSALFEDETVLGYHQRIEVVQLPVGDLSDQTLDEASVRETTGCTVLAVERDGETITDVDPYDLVLAPGDEVVVAGTDKDVDAFEERFLD